MARVNLATIAGTINPASADYLVHAISRSESEGADALLIELDTEGGLVSATKEIIQAILNAKVPVIVYVAPRGAWAASAGTYITVSGHVAAMAPSTSIGAAHPVGVSGGDEAPASVPAVPRRLRGDARGRVVSPPIGSGPPQPLHGEGGEHAGRLRGDDRQGAPPQRRLGGEGRAGIRGHRRGRGPRARRDRPRGRQPRRALREARGSRGRGRRASRWCSI